MLSGACCRRARLSALFAVVALLGTSPRAFAQIDARAFNAKVDTMIAKFKADHPKSDDVVAKAAGVLVCPQVKEAAFVFGVERGLCALREGGKTVGYYRSTGVKWGLVAGVQSQALMLVFKNQDSLAKFRDSSREWEVGVDAGVSVAKADISGDFDTTSLQAPIVAFAFNQKGLMGDVSLEGSRYKKLDDSDVYEGDALVRVVGHGKLEGSSSGSGGQIEILVRRWVTPAEREKLINVLKTQGASALTTAVKAGGSYGTVRAPGASESVDLRYAYADQHGDRWRMIFATTEPLGFASSWAGVRGAKHNTAVIITDVDRNQNGTGQLLMGGELDWDPSENHATIKQTSVPAIELDWVSAFK